MEDEGCEEEACVGSQWPAVEKPLPNSVLVQEPTPRVTLLASSPSRLSPLNHAGSKVFPGSHIFGGGSSVSVSQTPLLLSLLGDIAW